MPTVYLTPSDFEAARDYLTNCANCPVDFSESELDEISDAESHILDDLIFPPGTHELAEMRDDGILQVDQQGRLWLEIERPEGTSWVTERVQILPQALPGSWYDPALDPSAAPVVVPRNPWMVMLDQIHASSLPPSVIERLQSTLSQEFDRLSHAP